MTRESLSRPAAARLTPELHAQLLERYVRDWGDDLVESPRAAARTQLLPMYMDLGGFIGLRGDGELLTVDWDELEPEEGHEVEHDPRLRRMALYAGAERYPELSFLRPMRPREAVPCPQCRGRGHPLIEGEPAPDSVVCYCGALGWLLPDEAMELVELMEGTADVTEAERAGLEPTDALATEQPGFLQRLRGWLGR